jgi:6-pyruvoyltetrahydropterin/6-carboxytetrahydropterin synthase
MTGKFRVTKTFTVQMAHKVGGGYEVDAIHGHSAKITIIAEASLKPDEHMAINARHLKAVAKPYIDRLDDSFWNDIDNIGEHSSSETIAMWLWEHIAPELPDLMAIEIRFTETMSVTYFGPRPEEA